MELSVLERIQLQEVLPVQSSYVTLKIINDLRSDLSFSEKEYKDFGIVEILLPDGKIRYTWDDKKEKPKKVEIGEKATDIIVESLKRIDKEGRISNQNASLYEKFVLTIKT